MSLQLLFAEITKAEQRIVQGIASTAALDNQPGIWQGERYDGDVIDPSAIEGALADYLQWSNIREMHGNSAVGTALKAEVVDGQLMLTAEIVDDGAWEKVKKKVYKGFSIGGRVVKAVLETLADGRVIRRILQMVLSEISLVDRPANPEARILLWKADRSRQERNMTLDELYELMKAAADPAKIISLIQAARNQCELDGDLPGADLYTQAIALIMQAAGEAEPEESEPEPAAEGEAAPEDEAAMAMSHKMSKAGRKLSGSNLAAMHKVLKAMIDMMAAAGDEVATKLQLAYGMDKMAADAPNFKKLASDIAPQFDKLAVILKQMDGRLQAIEQQPVPGGPILRPVEKLLATSRPATTPAEPEWQTTYKAERLIELRRLAATEPNPSLRENYQKELAALAA